MALKNKIQETFVSLEITLNLQQIHNSDSLHLHSLLLLSCHRGKYMIPYTASAYALRFELCNHLTV